MNFLLGLVFVMTGVSVCMTTAMLSWFVDRVEN